MLQFEKEKKDFAKWRATREHDRKDLTSRCDVCFDEQRQEEKNLSQLAHATFQKLRKQ